MKRIELAITCHWSNPPRTRPRPRPRKGKTQIALVLFRCPDTLKMRFEGPAASVLFYFCFWILQVRYIALAIYIAYAIL